MVIYVVDQNRMRKQELQDIIAREPDARFVIPDAAFVEMSKHANWEYTMRLSLVPLMPAIERTFLSLSVGEAMKVEFASLRPIDGAALLPDQFREFVRLLADELNQERDGSSKIHIRSNFGSARASLLTQDLDAEGRKSKVLDIVKKWVSALKPEVLKAFRGNVYGDRFRLSFIQVNVDIEFFHQVTEVEGLSESQSNDFMATRPMVLRYLYLLVRHVVNWAIAGGLTNVEPSKELNHLLDMEYAAVASFFDGLITEDGEAGKAYEELKTILGTSLEDAMACYEAGMGDIFKTFPVGSLGKDGQQLELSKKEEEEEDISSGGAGDVQSRAITNNERQIRQAVVVIHGVGEQRPMDTLRSFVDAVLVNNPKYSSKYRSKPDAMNELFEMRCLQAPGNSSRPLTDFYEYYWAHHMQGSKYTQVLAWLKGLMLRHPKMIPPALRPAYIASWILVLFALSLWLYGLISAKTGHVSFLDGVLQQKWLYVGGLVILLIQWAGSYFVLGHVAEAARYLTPSPDNIEARNKIRSEGTELLRTLHASGKYKRIVIVGHSLGSVIGYDIIRNLWVDMRKPIVPHPRKQPEFKNYECEAKKIEVGEVTSAKIEAFQQCQHRVWQEFVEVGIPWLITDFITLGSPLAHAQLLMADSPEDFERKKLEYEYPCCPHNVGEKPYYGQNYHIYQGGKSVIRNILIPHHGAPFSCIRWTNLFFPYRCLILGDLIGGRLNGVFGKGIRDIPVGLSTDKYRDRTLVSHTRYWAGSGKGGVESIKKDFRPSLVMLRNVMRLDFLRGKSAKAKPGGAP